jgi:hypothetical protein
MDTALALRLSREHKQALTEEDISSRLEQSVLAYKLTAD